MIHLAIAFDNNYLLPFYALVASIFENNTKNNFHFHCIIRNIDSKEKQEIIDYIAKNQSKINFYEVDETLISQFVTRSHWNTSVYYKMFFPLLVKDVDRLLYLDTDMLVVGSLKALYETDLSNYPLAAVADPHVKNEVYWELHTREYYFNSGMMLIDVDKWNNLQVSQQALSVLNNEPEKIIYVDQDALNIVLDNNCVLVSEKYNYTYTHIPKEKTQKELKEILQNIVILHFTISRPWLFLCKNYYRYLYGYYLKKSPKKQEKIIIDFSYSKLFAYFRIRLTEFYLSTPFVHKIWRFIKKK